MTRARQIGLGLAGSALVLDQLTKWWILAGVMNPPRLIEVTSFFNLVLVWNRGVSFGLFASDSPHNAWLLSGVAMVICAALAIWMWRSADTLTNAALGLIIGGAAGNVIDRARFGAVTDFLDFHAAGYHWPAFNVADAAVCAGAALLILESLFSREK